MLESSPPDKKAHTGTSLTSCRSTASVTSSRTWAAVSSKVSAVFRSSGAQYRQTRHPVLE